MNGRHWRRTGLWSLAALGLGAAGAVCPAASWAGTPSVSVGILGGGVQPDADLADYNWDATARGIWGLETTAGFGRITTGLRFLRWQTRQSTGIPGDDASPVVRVSRLEAILRGNVLSRAGFRFLGTAALGRVHLGYSPDRLEIDTGSGPVEVAFAPVDDWSGAFGLAVERDLGRRWVLGTGIEQSLFAVDTAHRSGSTIVEERRTFSSWNVSVRLSWMLRNN